MRVYVYVYEGIIRECACVHECAVDMQSKLLPLIVEMKCLLICTLRTTPSLNAQALFSWVVVDVKTTRRVAHILKLMFYISFFLKFKLI